MKSLPESKDPYTLSGGKDVLGNFPVRPSFYLFTAKVITGEVGYPRNCTPHPLIITFVSYTYGSRGFI